MPTYFSINDGNFGTATVFATTLAGGVTAGTVGNLLTTTFSYPTTLATSNGTPICGIALQLSAVSGAPTGTIDLILSGTDGNSTGTVSYPVSGLALYDSSTNIVPNYPLGWQYFELPSPITIATTRTMRVGVKTSVSNKVSLMGTLLTNLNRHYVTTTNGSPSVSTDVTHIVGSLTTAGLIPKTVYYNVNNLTLGDFYVHNGGILNFDHSSTITLTLIGTRGMQITPNGTVNIGTSDNPVDATKIHSINLSNCHINVHNGASLNSYGAYKPPYALITRTVAAGVPFYPVSIDLTKWRFKAGGGAEADKLVITPSTGVFNAFESSDAYFEGIRPNGDIYVGGILATYTQISSDYIPSIVNMTRNVQISANSGYIRFLDGSNSNINNTQFKGFRNATYKGIQFCTNSTGSVSLSNCAFNGDSVATMPAFSFESTKAPTSNISIKECNFFGYGATTDIITLNALSTNNFTFTDNIVLSSSQNGMLINGLSSTYANIKGNFLIGNRQNGLYVTNPYLLSGSIGGIGCINNICGSVVAGANNKANYDGLAGFYNTTEGVNIFGNIPLLSSTTFRNLTANNNKTSGIMLSGNSNNLSSPIKVNIDGVLSNNNKRAGLEGYAITGNLSSMSFVNNISGNIYASIGNGDIIFDNVTSSNTPQVTAQLSNVHILSGKNYGATLFKNSNLTGNLTNAIKFNNTKFEQFSMDSSTLSSNAEDIGSSSDIDFLQGSYQFNNCTFGTGILSSTIENYQPEVFTENGFVVMKENGVANKHYKLLGAGKISLDETLAKSPNTISEKLEPTSTITKLRCGSKMVPVNKTQSYTIGCYVYKSSGYSGAAPRLMLKHNSALGYKDTVLATSVGADETWELLSGTVPAALDQGIFEVYVDCSGESGSGSVNIDNWTLV